MIFDAYFDYGVVRFKCALEDYEDEPVFHKDFVLGYKPGKEEGDDWVPVLESGPWQCLDPQRQPGKVPPWAQRLTKVLEPRIMGMLLTGIPKDLRRWIDDEVLCDIEVGLANKNDRLPANT